MLKVVICEVIKAPALSIDSLWATIIQCSDKLLENLLRVLFALRQSLNVLSLASLVRAGYSRIPLARVLLLIHITRSCFHLCCSLVRSQSALTHFVDTLSCRLLV